MTLALRIMFLAALIAWVGEIFFFSFVAAPAMFATLSREAAGRLAAVLLSRYYAIGVVAGSIMLAALLGMAWRASRRRRHFAGAALTAGMLGMTLYAAVVIQPRANTLRAHAQGVDLGSTVAKVEFDRIHRQAVQLNGLTLLCGLGVIGLTASMLRDGP